MMGCGCCRNKLSFGATYYPTPLRSSSFYVEIIREVILIFISSLETLALLNAGLRTRFLGSWGLKLLPPLERAETASGAQYAPISPYDLSRALRARRD